MRPGIINRLMETLMLLLMASAPVAFGSVHVIAYSALEAGCFGLFILWALKMRLSGEGFERRLLPLWWLWIGFMGLGMFMLVPLPASWAGVLSPKAHELFSLSIKGYGNRAYDIYRSLSMAPHLTLSSLLKTAAYGAVFFVAAHEFRDRGKTRRLVLVLLLVGLGEAVFGLYNFFHSKTGLLGIEREGVIRAASGTYINRNHFAGLLGMVFFTGMGMLLSLMPPESASRKTSPADAGGLIWPLGAVLGLIATGIGFSLSRMAMAGGLATFTLSLLVLGRHGMRRHVALALAAAGFGLALLASYGLEPLIRRIDTNTLASTRPEIWAATLDMARAFPLLGSGPGTFREVFQLFAPGGIPSLTLQAHCDYLELVSEAGALGGAIGIAAAGYFITLALRTQNSTPDHEARMLSLGALGGVCYILFFSITDFNLQIPANAMLFGILGGLALGAASGEPSKEQSIRWSWLKTGIAISLALGALVLASNQLRAEASFPVERAFFRTSAELVPTDETEEAGALRAARLVPMNALYPLALGQYRMTLATAATPDKAREHIEAARGYFRRALELSPANLQARGRLAWAGLASGDYLSGMRELDIALDIAPTSHQSHMSFAQAVTTYIDAFPPPLRNPMLYRAQGEYAEAIRLNPALAGSVHVVMAKADMHMLSGARDKAIETLASYTVYTPEALPAHLRLARMHVEDSEWMKAALLYRRLHSRNYRLAPEASRSAIQNALRKDAADRPDVMPLQNVLAETAAASGNHEARIEALERLMAHSGSTQFKSATAVKIGESLEALGKAGKAGEMYTQAITLDHSNEEAKERLAGIMRKAQ